MLMGLEQDSAARPARPGSVPVLPSEAEVEQHEMTHLPFRSCCRHCTRAKSKESPHPETSPGGVSKFATDYMFMRRDGTPINILAGFDGLTEAFFANVVPCKGTSHGHAERALAHNVLSTNHQRVILQSDQEPSIIDVKHKAGTHIPTEIESETATPTAALSQQCKPSMNRFARSRTAQNDRLVRRSAWTAQF